MDMDQANVQFFLKNNQLNQQKKLKSKQFICPTNQFLNVTFESIGQIHEYIQNNQQKKYFKIKKRGKYIYLNCRYCIAKISFCLTEQGYIIKNFNNQHEHFSKKNKQVEKELVMELFSKAQKIQTPKETKQRILNLVPINQRRYNYIINCMIDSNNYKQTERYMENNNYFVKVKHDQQQDLPELILIMSPQMRKWALKYGDIFCFDVTYHLIKNRSKDNKQWGVGIFTGIDSNLGIIPIAYSLILRQDTNNFKALFRGFLELVQTRVCTFITDQQKAIKSALDLLYQEGLYNGNHVLDDFHLIRNVKSKVKQVEFPLYYKLITTKCSIKCKQIYQLLRDQTDSQDVLKYLWDNKERTCFSQGKNKFVGLRYSTSRSEKCNDIIKTMIPKSTNLFRLIHAFQKLQNKILARKPKYSSKRFQLFFNDDRLQQVRKSVEQKIFNVFLQNYILGLKMTPKIINSFKQYDVQGYKTNGNQCQCGINIKNGIPCPHMLSILIRFTKISYTKYFNWRWVDLHQLQKKQLYIIKKTRRRIR